MSRSCHVSTTAIVLLVFGLAFVACENEETGSLFDPGAPLGATPSITTIAPADSARAGVDTLTITGANFSATLDYNIVYFNAEPGVILQASTTQLTVVPPAEIGDTVIVRVAVRGAQLLSDPAFYKLQPGAEEFGNLGPEELAGGIATTSTGNLFVAIGEGPFDKGIFVFTPSGTRTTFAPPTSGVSLWAGLKVGPGGYLYATRNIRAVFRYDPAGGSPAALWVAFPAGVSILDFDFDQNQFLWAVGNNSVIYCIKQDQSVTTSPFVGNIKSVRVFGTDLYFAAAVGGEDKIYRAPILGDTLGTPVVYYDFTAAFGAQGYIPQTITLASDGSLYIGTNGVVGIVIVNPSLSASTPFGAYSALFGQNVKSLAWGPGEFLYARTADGGLLRLLTRQTGAPYYGAP